MSVNFNLLFAIFVLFIHYSCFGSAKNVKKAFEKNEIVPDVIDEAPESELKIKYSSKVKVKLGNELTPTQVKDQPSRIDYKADSNSYYTLLKVDPDAPSRENPEFRELCHWIVVNIPGKNFNQGEVIYEYLGARPPKGSGRHRYIFLIYGQNGKQEFDEPKVGSESIEERQNFTTRDFISKYQLSELIAGNFYEAQWDELVGE